MDWLTKIDPNTLITLGGVILGGLTWLYHKAKGDQVANFADTFRGIGKSVLHTLLIDPTITSDANIDALKIRASQLVWRAADGASIPRNAITVALVNALVEHTIGDLLAELRARDSLQAKVAALSDQIATMPAQWAAAEARGRAAVAGMASMIDTTPDVTTTAVIP